MFPALQDCEIGRGVNGLEESRNVAYVTFVSVSIASLNVKTTVVVVETPAAPLAGMVEMMVGCACTCLAPINMAKAKTEPRTL